MQAQEAQYWASRSLKCGIFSLKSNSFKFFQETEGKEFEQGKKYRGKKSVMEIASSALIHKKLVSYQLQMCKSQLFLKLQDSDSKIWSSKNSFIFYRSYLATSTVL